MIQLIVYVIILLQGSIAFEHSDHCTQLQLVESIPLQVDLKFIGVSTYEAWKNMIKNSKETIYIAQYYFTLTDGKDWSPQFGGYMGNDIFNLLIEAKQERNVSIHIVQNFPSVLYPDNETALLAEMGVAKVRSLDWTKLVSSGILHTKLLISDNNNAYIGSANTDWRSLSQVKELGILIENCPLIAEDIAKIFWMYWEAANMKDLPKHWPSKFDTIYNINHPAILDVNNEPTKLFISSSPQSFCPKGRTNDLDSLLSAIYEASESISIEVMDYSSSSLYSNPNFYWPLISDALKTAAFNRGVQVRLLVSLWPYSINSTWQFLNDLNSIENIKVKFFYIPDMKDLPVVPYTRVNHAKFMVTERQTYVGTSNWSADYYLNTGGVSWNIHNSQIKDTIQEIFDRDWNSNYTLPLSFVSFY